MVVKLIVGAETFTLRTASYAAGDIKFFRHHVVPDSGYGVEICAVFRERGHIGHTRIKIAGTHCMAHNLLLVEDRHMILGIGARLASVGEAPCLLYKIFCLVEIFLVARHLI